MLVRDTCKGQEGCYYNNILLVWQCADNYEFTDLGRIWILSNATVSLSMHSASSQAIHCHPYLKDTQRYLFLSVLYASNDDNERRIL